MLIVTRDAILFDVTAVDANFAFVTFASFIFAVVTASSAISAVTTPPSLIVTAPEETAKLSLENDATPLLDVLASSPAIVNKLPVRVVSSPYPPIILNSSPSEMSKTFELSSPIVIDEFTS